jgi:L-methionine (R)-S-oxide reductase
MNTKKISRYQRIYQQIKDLISDCNDLQSKMATVNAVLHHKMEGFFWTGFYLHKDGNLLVGPYQGPLACIKLTPNKGVCWAAVNSGKSIIVPDVHLFEGHIACDSRSKSEIAIPLSDKSGKVIAVLDIDSNRLANFDESDREELEKIMSLL